MTTPRLNASFIMVPCRCGRVLRAKRDQVGSEIRCWDCHQTNPVVIPQARRRIVSQIFKAIFYLFNGQGTGNIVLGAAFLTLTLMVPYIGLGLAALLMVCGAAFYGDLIQSEDHLGSHFEPDWTRIRRRITPTRLAACVLFAAGTLLPLWIINAGPRRSPHLNAISLPILGLSWTLLPILMTAVFINPGVSDRKFSERFEYLLVHPITSLLVLAIVPGFLLACEAVLGGLLFESGLLPFFALEHMPIPGKPIVADGILFYDFISYVEMSPKFFIRGYFSGLQQGYSFVGSIPPSMSVPTQLGMNPRAILMTWEFYTFLRLLIVFVISLVLTLSFAIQARCLSVLVNAKRFVRP